jgi:NADH-quinone oxidoreductase subunit G
LSDLTGTRLPFDRFDQLRAAMIADTPALGLPEGAVIELGWKPPKLDGKAGGPVDYPIKDFYLTNAICRASPTMRRCSEELVHGVEFREAAE